MNDMVAHDIRNHEIVTGRLEQGHQVASGKNGDPRFPGGTLAMQISHFRQRGLDLEGYHRATLNVSFAPRVCEIDPSKADFTFRKVRWHPVDPAEDFSFFHVFVRRHAGDLSWVPALIYYPHPETKPDHFQPDGMLEILAVEKLRGLCYGDLIDVVLDLRQVKILPTESRTIRGDNSVTRRPARFGK